MNENIGVQPTGTSGTGKYEGYTWNGRAWVSLEDGHRGQFDPWQRTARGWRILFIGLAAAGVVGFALFVSGVWGS